MGIEVVVLTAMPNYPKMKIFEGYRNDIFSSEVIDGIKVYRSWIYVSKSKSIVSRLLNYFSFVKSSFFCSIFVREKIDFILCESPPLFLGITAYLLSKLKKAKLIFNVSDLWPESAEKLGLVKNRLLLSMAYKLEKFLYNKSVLVSGQTMGIVENIKQRFPHKKTYWLKNGVDISLFDATKSTSDWREEMKFKDEDFIVYYGGLMGYAQAIEVILYAAEILRDKQSIKFVLLGSGPEKEKLLQLKEKLNLSNVYFFDLVQKKEMPIILNAIDTAIIPLKKLDLFKGAIPSKIFEILAMSKPILLGVEGEAKTLFIEQGNAGLAFEPENSKDLAAQILKLQENKNLSKQYGINGNKYVTKNFNRDIIAKDFYNEIIQL